jgi:DNA primase
VGVVADDIAAILPFLKEVSPTSRGWVARCPFHPDGGRRNLYVYADTGSFYCYRCGAAGTARTFFRRLGEGPPPAQAPAAAPPRPRNRTPAQAQAVALAAALYAADADHPAAREYLAARRIPPELARAFALGYARGDRLEGALRREGGPGLLKAAREAGLLRADGTEVLAGRLTIPELRGDAAVFLVGRSLRGETPKYLGVTGPRPLYFAERAAGRAFAVVEGYFDALACFASGVPAVALGGSPSRTAVAALRRAALKAGRRPVLIPDADPPGEDAARRLRAAVPGLVVARLPEGFGDPAELYERAGPGALREVFLSALKQEEEDIMYCRIAFIGNLGADPEVRYTADGRMILSFRAAVNFRRGGAEETFWFAVAVFGPQAERLNERLRKGARVLVDGRLDLRRFTRRDGSEGLGLDVTADRVLPLDRTEPAEPADDDIPF